MLQYQSEPILSASEADMPICEPIVAAAHAKDAASTGYYCRASASPQEWITVTARVGRRAYALRIQGDSMEPKFPGDVITIVDPDVEPVHGSIVVALLADAGQATLKQLVIDSKRYLKPLNPRYPIMEMGDRMATCGLVK